MRSSTPPASSSTSRAMRAPSVPRSGRERRSAKCARPRTAGTSSELPTPSCGPIMSSWPRGHSSLPVLAARLSPAIRSLHTDDYWAPEDLPPGGVLVVGTGQSGLQIGDELARAGRAVTVAVGRHGWVPRRVYGRDQMTWRWDNGDYRSVVADPDHPKADYPFTFLARWGAADFNVRTVWASGVRLAGHLTA